jgi:hypothetical protein
MERPAGGPFAPLATHLGLGAFRIAFFGVVLADVLVPLALDLGADEAIERRPWRPLGWAHYRGGAVTLEWSAPSRESPGESGSGGEVPRPRPAGSGGQGTGNSGNGEPP